MSIQKTYQTNGNVSCLTTLQRNLWEHYNNSVGSFSSNNTDVLKEITNIAGNRGYSHLKRIEKVSNILSQVNGSLNESEKQYAHDMLDISYNYLRETRSTRDDKLRLMRKVKDYSAATRQIMDLRRSYEPNNRGYSTFCARQSELEQSVKSEEMRPQVIDIQDYQRRPKYRPSLLRKAGTTLVRGIIGVAVLGIIVGSYFLGAKGKKTLVEKRDALANAKQALIEDKYNDLSSENTLLSEKVKQYKQYLEENITSLTENTELARIIVQSYNEEKERAKKSMEARLYEGKRIHQIVGNETLRLPSFPLATATLDAKTGVIKNIFTVEYNKPSIVETKEQLEEMANVVSRLYEPPFTNSSAFEELTEAVGGSSEFASQIENSKDMTPFDKLVLFSMEYQNSFNRSDFSGLIVRKTEGGNIKVIGSLGDILKLKSGSSI